MVKICKTNSKKSLTIVDSSFGDHCRSLITQYWELWRIWIKVSSLALSITH